MSSKSVLRHGFKAEAERVSEKYRTQLGISKFGPLDAFALAKHIQVPVISVNDFAEDVSSTHLETLRDTSKFSAMWMPNAQGDKIVIHNNFHSEKRQQSNIMHELAHIILDHKISDEAAALCFSYGLHYFNTEQEQEAKLLGGCLQITRPALQWALKQNFSEQQISDYFNASMDMVKYRLNSTGVLIQRRYQANR
jgi:Zn-dependent peptidase ImmA (M78 family)